MLDNNQKLRGMQSKSAANCLIVKQKVDKTHQTSIKTCQRYYRTPYLPQWVIGKWYRRGSGQIVRLSDSHQTFGPLSTAKKSSAMKSKMLRCTPGIWFFRLHFRSDKMTRNLFKVFVLFFIRLDGSAFCQNFWVFRCLLCITKRCT